MSFCCPVSSCGYATRRISRKEMREDGDRCLYAGCGALLVKAFAVASPAPIAPAKSNITIEVCQLYAGPQVEPRYLQIAQSADVKAAELAAKRQQIAALAKELALERAHEALLDANLLASRAFVARQEKKAVAAATKQARKLAFEKREAKRASRKAAAAVLERRALIAQATRKRLVVLRRERAEKARKQELAADLAARRAAGATRKSALRRCLKKKAVRAAFAPAPLKERREPKLGSIFPFSASLFGEVKPTFVGTPFDPPSLLEGDILPPPPPFVGLGHPLAKIGSTIVELAPSLGEIFELGNPGSRASFYTAIERLSSASTFAEIFAFHRAVVNISQLFITYPCVYTVGDFCGFWDGSADEIAFAIRKSKEVTATYALLLNGNPIVHSFLDSIKSMGHTIGQVVRHPRVALSTCANAISQTWHGTFEFILNKCHEIFFKIFAPHLATIHRAGEEIGKFWQRCKEWATNLWNKSHLALQALGTYAIWALMLTIMCGIVYLVETILISASAISTHGVLVSIFLSITMAAAGYTIFTMGRESAQLIRTMREAILMTVLPDDVTREVARSDPDVQHVHSLLDVAMAPVNFLETVASGLSLFSTSSITVLGKLGNSLEGIRKGYNCLTDFLSIFFEKMGGLWETCSGKRTSFFRDLTTTIKVNLTSWTQDARRLIEYHEMAGSLDKYEYEKVRTLIYQGEEIVDTANKSRASHTSNQFLRTVGALLTDLKEVRSKCARSLRFDGWRRQPFWVYIYGASQCGKSTLANYLAPNLLTHMGWDAHDVYSKDPTESYWSGYYQQKCLKMNDLSAVVPKNVTPLEQQLIPLISTEEKMVSAAEITGKGIQFLSEIAISSSNVDDAPTACEILDADAYKLRRKVLLQCRRAAVWQHDDKGNRTELIDAEGKMVSRPYDPSDALSCTEVRWLHPASNTPISGPSGQWHMAHSTIPMIYEAMDAHFTQEDFKREAWVQKTNMHSRTGREVSTYLQSLVTALGSYKAIQKASETSSAGERKFLVAVDSKIYSIDSLGMATAESDDAYDNVEALESTTLLQYRLDFAKQVREHALLTNDGSFHSSMVRDLLEDMLVNDACVVSVDKLSRDTKQIHRDLWGELKLAERIFLRVSQKALNQFRDQPHMKAPIDGLFLQHMKSFLDSVVNNRQKILLFLAGILLVGVSAYSFFSLLRTFLSGSIGFGSALALKNQLDTHSSVAASGSIVQSFSSRNIPIVWAKSARYANVHSNLEEQTTFNLFDDGLAHLLVRLQGTSGQSETAILFGPRAIALCCHQIRCFPDGDRVLVNYLDKNRVARNFPITWHWNNVLEQDDTEVCVYRDDQLTPLPVYPDSLYLRADTKLPTALNINGVSIKKRKFFEDSSLTPDERLLEPDSSILRTWSNVAALSTTKQTISNPAPGVAYTRDLNRYLTSSYAAGVHDSGGLISIMHQGQRKVVGLHVAGIRSGHLFKSTISFLPHGNYADVHSTDEFFKPEFVARTNGFDKIGFIEDPGKAPHISTSSQLGRVPKNFEIPLPVYDEDEEENFLDCGETFEIKEPAILSKKDSRLEDPDNFRPLQDGMMKFANPMKVMDETILVDVCEDIYTSWYDSLPTSTAADGSTSKIFLEKVDLDVALNGVAGDAYMEAMKLDTSEGYPHCVRRAPGESGKRRFVDIDDDFHVTLKKGTDVHDNYQKLKSTVSTRVPTLNCVECLKDECLKKRKVATPRLFDVMPFEHNILLREYFLSFSSFIQANRINLPACIGTNVYSREWTTLYDRLAEYSDTGLNCDYSKFDGYISHQVYSWMVATINRLFRDGEEANSARRNLMLMFIGRRSIAERQVYMVRGGMPSGCAFTALINSLFNEILIRYVFRKVVPRPSCNYFNKYVRLMVYGDDNLITIKEEIIPYFDGPVIKEEMAELGITITDGTDKSSPTLQRKPLKSLEFLKRGFRKQPSGVIVAPLDKTSMYTRLYYSTAGVDGVYSLDILRDNVKSFLEEIVLHPNHTREFNRVRDFYLNKCPHWANYLPTYNAAIDFHYRQQTTMSPYQTQRIFETRPNGGEYKMMAGQDKEQGIIHVTDRLAIIGMKTEIPTDRPGFVVALDAGVRACERGVVYSVETSDGNGRLPTQRWVDSFSSFKKRALLHEAYGEGCTIYFRSPMPRYLSWCALGGFARSLGIDRSSIIALFEEYKPRNAGDIAPLLASKEYKRHVSRPIFSFGKIHQQLAGAKS